MREPTLGLFGAEGEHANSAIFLAVLGGVSWGFTPLAKSLGVSQPYATGANRFKLSIYTCAALKLGAGTVAVLIFFSCADPAEKRQVMQDPGWRSKLPVVAACGFSAGLGTILATYAFSFEHKAVYLISLITTSLCTVCSPLIVLLYFEEKPDFLQWLSLCSAVAGAILGDLGRSAVTEDTETSKADADEGTGDSSKAIFIAAVAGLFFSAGALGKSVGAKSGAALFTEATAVCTMVVVEVCSAIPTYLMLLFASGGCITSSIDPNWWRECCLWVIFLGVLGGAGTPFGIYSVEMAPPRMTAVVQSVELGTAVIFSSFVLAVYYRSMLTPQQVMGSLLIMTSILLAELSTRDKTTVLHQRH